MSRLGAFLVQEGILTVADRQVIKRESAAFHGSFARSVLAMGLLDEDELTALMASKTGCQQVAKDILQEMDPSIATLIPLHVLTWLEVLPLSVSDGLLRLGMVDTTDQDAINQIKFFTGLRVKPMIAKLSEIHRGLRKIGAPLDLGESGFEGLLRTLGRPPLESAIAKPKPKPKSESTVGVKNFAPTRLATPSPDSEQIPKPLTQGLPVSTAGLDLNDQTLAAGAPDEALDDTNVGLEINLPPELEGDEVADDSSVLDPDAGLSLDGALDGVHESEPMELPGEVVGDVNAAQDDALSEIAAENFAAAQAPANLGEEPSSESMDVPSVAEDDVVEELKMVGTVDEQQTEELAEEQSIDELVEEQSMDELVEEQGIDELAEEQSIDELAEEQSMDELVEEYPTNELSAPASDSLNFEPMTDMESGDTNNSEVIGVNESEPPLADIGSLSVDNQPMIGQVQGAAPSEPRFDFFDANESSIEVSSHSGIADLNRVLISLQMTTDSNKAFKKIAEAACKVGINRGAVVILRGNEVFPGVSWSNVDSKVEFMRDLPLGYNADSVIKIVGEHESDVWSDYHDSHSPEVTHILVIKHRGETVVCMAAFNGAADHEGLRQSFGDVIRAVPVHD